LSYGPKLKENLNMTHSWGLIQDLNLETWWKKKLAENQLSKAFII